MKDNRAFDPYDYDILEETRERKRQLGAAFGFDVHRLAEEMRRQDAEASQKTKTVPNDKIPRAS